MLGQHPRLACAGRRVSLLDGPLTAQNRTGSPVFGVDELRPLDADEAAVAGRLLVQGPQVDAARRGERVGLRVEGEPALVRLGHAAGGRGELVGLEGAPRA